MKKVVKMLGLCALVALAFTACKKNETNGNVKFKATLSQPATDTRTHIEIDGNGIRGLYWNLEDNIKVVNKVNNLAESFTLVDKNGQEAYFEGDAGFLANLDTDSSYIAFYPNAVEGEGCMELQVKPVQNFGWDTFDNNTYPMYGFNGKKDQDNNFEFHSHAGILEVAFQLKQEFYPEGTEIALSNIVLTGDESDVLSCTMQYDFNGVKTIKDDAIKSNSITLNCEDEDVKLLRNRPTFFYFVLPEGALANGFTITLNTIAGGSLTYEVGAHQENTIVAEQITWFDRKYIAEPDFQ
jgi:hypothetical protein